MLIRFRDPKQTFLLIDRFKELYPTGHVEWVGVDIQEDVEEEVRRRAIQEDPDRVHVSGIRGTFDEALSRAKYVPRPKVVTCWGSTLLNTSAQDPRPPKEEHAPLLDALQPGDWLLFSQDRGPADRKKMLEPYKAEAFKNFAEGIYNVPLISAEDWDVLVVEEENPLRVTHFLVAKHGVSIGSRLFKAGNRVEFFSSMKLGVEYVIQTCESMGLQVENHWTVEGAETGEHALSSVALFVPN